MKLYYKKRGKMNQSADATAFLEHIFRLNFAEKMPQIKKTPNGKPYFHEKPEIHFSLSHSKNHILCAISPAPVGVDIETERPISEKVESYFATTEELKHFTPLELWVLKESYIKLFGKTLADIKTLRFSRKGNNIITPDNSVKSQLYRIESAYIAVSTLGDVLPDHIADSIASPIVLANTNSNPFGA